MFFVRSLQIFNLIDITYTWITTWMIYHDLINFFNLKIQKTIKTTFKN